MIEVEGLTKYYGEHAAIEDLGFAIERGEVIGFLGLNGAGKSTSLKILGCVLLPTSGRVVIDGYDAVRDPHEVRKRIGFLPDTPPLYDEMSVDGYLRFVARLRGVSSGEAAARVAEAEEKTALTDVHDQVIGTLSHGYRQRVGLAQALVHRPRLLILDEPASGLDPEQIVEMRALLRRLRGEHTILLSSHNLPEVAQTCDRLLVINRGRLVAAGTEEELVGRLGGASRGVVVEVPRAMVERARAALIGAAGVREVTEEEGAAPGDPSGGPAARLVVDAPTEARAELVRTLVTAGVDLLGLELAGPRQSAQLESIFLRLTRPGAQSATTVRA